MKNFVILAVCVGFYCLVGIVTMIAYQSISSLMAMGGVGSDVIGWFVYCISVPWGVRFLYASFVEGWRKQSVLKLQVILASSVTLATLSLLVMVFFDPISHLFVLFVVVFVGNAALCCGDIALSGVVIDELKDSLKPYANGSRVIFSALAPVISGWMFFKILSASNASNAFFVVFVLAILFALPAFFLFKAKFGAKYGTHNAHHKPSLKNFFANKNLRNTFFLLLFAQSPTSLWIFFGGAFLSAMGLSPEEIGATFGVYGVIASVSGGVLASRLCASFDASKIFRLVLLIEACLSVLLFFVSDGAVSHTSVMIVFCFSSFLINFKFVTLCTLAMGYAKGDQSGVNFSVMIACSELFATILSVIGGYIIVLGWGYLFGICFILAILAFVVFRWRSLWLLDSV
ncbi:hypothetical protein [Helicobacter sp. 11S02596-1]|uniref:hypothetical protein n=1 Tax=Helicobacter sp. 11S02596-1 TaxID=1476194 RepID=UPI000BA7CEA4|nr:hypothetical protein [Helicobacter sp. 11S02596-1]PAF44248.1 hypothetical protein BJI48_03445 [Helicobacter sp. 11S02596-1]